MKQPVFILDSPVPVQAAVAQEQHNEKPQPDPSKESAARPQFALDTAPPSQEKHAPDVSGKIAREIRVDEANVAQQAGGADPDIAAADRALLYEAYSDDGQRAELEICTDSLIDDDFPFDESQIAAIKMVASQQYACMTGAAGTGKTTCTKAIIQAIQEQIGTVDINKYFTNTRKDESHHVAAIALCAYTGRASQMIKKNFPESWHNNIMTIHRLLAYQPEYYEEMDEANGIMVRKMRFVPTYTAGNKLPWDVIVIDEAGMLALDLWEKLWAACKPGTRIIMIGDINQLPPVHGTSIFGYAMSKWPTAELTHIHRQKGEENVIVENAWRILQGRSPIGGEFFQMIETPEMPGPAAKQLRGVMKLLEDNGIYVPTRDTVITATNGELGQRGYELGQIPLNESLALIFNPDAQRLMIDAGRERRNFAIGDKVMVTRNDHTIGITNGMTGVVTEVRLNPNYSGDLSFVGNIESVDAAMTELHAKDKVDTAQLLEDLSAQRDSDPEAVAKRDRGHASHIIKVEFSEELTTEFQTFAEVISLQVAYVITCHKSQGGEYPLVMIMCHDHHRHMMYREWLYTAVTRSSEKVVLFYNKIALAGALNKQKIKGATLEEKVQAFIGWEKSGLKNVPELPESEEIAS